MKIKTETETGSIVSFKYDNEIAEITGLTTSFEPKQDGTPWMSDIEQTPYLLRRSPDLDHDYDREIDTLVGGTIAWNQLFSARMATATVNGVTVTNNNDGSFTLQGTATADSSFRLNQSTVGAADHLDTYYAGHKYLILGNDHVRLTIMRVSTWNIFASIYRAGIVTSNQTLDNCFVYMPIGAGVALDWKITPQIIDLTATFGTEIADYAYSLEQSTAGSGIAWLKSHGFLTKDYYAYDDGSLVSVKTSEHRTTGKNLIPVPTVGTTTNGITFTPQSDGGIKVNGTATALALIDIGRYSWELAKGNYYLSFNTTNIDLTLYKQDSSAVFVRNTNGAFSVSDIGSYFFRVSVPSGRTVDAVVYPQIEFGNQATAFEPYTLHSYPLDSDLELRGIPKLSNGSLYYDGDEYRADGTVTRKYGIVDLGTLDYTYDSALTRFATGGLRNVIKAPASNVRPNLIASGYVTYKNNDAWQGTINMSCFVSGSSFLYLVNHAYTDAATFKTAMSGVYLVYELATPTTETADPFTSPQIVSPLGTEEYVDTRDVPVPVGHRTVYADIYPISGWDEVKAYVSPTEEEEDATIYTINLNGTRYGGTIDFFRGVMNVAYAYANMGSLTWSKENASGSHWRFRANISDIKQNTSASNVMPVWCSAYEAKSPNQTWNGETGISVSNGVRAVQVASENFSDATSFKNAMSGVQLVYELAEPIEVQLTAEQIEALQGQNYVWCDSGDTTLTWRHIPVLDEAVMLNGKYLELTIDGYSTLGTSGRRSLGRQLDTFSVGTADGETVKNSTFPSRKITVNYVIQTDTEEELTDAINQLANILNQKECDFIFRDEPDKYFSGYGLLDSEPKKYRHAVKGTWTIYCAYPFKRSVETTELVSTESAIVEDYAATFEFNYNGTLPARPILRAEFASAKSGGDYSEDGDCGFVAFVDPSKNIIQLGNPDIVDLDQYEQYANETLVNSVFDDLTGWTASGITVGSIADQFWNNGAGQTQNYAKGTGALYRSVTGSVNFDFSMVHRLCVSGEGETGKFEALAKNGNDIVAGFRIEKTGNGTSGTVYYILNNKVVGKDIIDLSYYNTNFGYCKRDPVYVDKFGRHDPFDPFHDPFWYVSPVHRHDPFYYKHIRGVQRGWNYTQSNLNSRINKNGKVVTFTIGTLAQRTFKSSDIEFSPATIVTFNLAGGFNTNAVRSAKFTKGAGTTFSNVPNVFTAGDIVEADCNSADVTIYRAGSIEGRLEPKYGALGNDWEQFVIRPGTNVIRAVWSNWVDTDYKPEIRIIFNEVYL